MGWRENERRERDGQNRVCFCVWKRADERKIKIKIKTIIEEVAVAAAEATITMTTPKALIIPVDIEKNGT